MIRCKPKARSPQRGRWWRVRLCRTGPHRCACSFLGLLVALTSACAAAPPPPAVNPARAACERETGPECVDLLTRPQTESRQQIEAKEADRRADDFRGRLAGLRAAEESRWTQRHRARTATVAVARLLDRQAQGSQAWSEPDGDSADLDEPADSLAAIESPDARSATKAPVPAASAATPAASDSPAAPPASAPRIGTAPEPKSVDGAPAQAVGDKAAAFGEAPTPELLLRGAHCLLGSDYQAGRNALAAYRKAAGDREKAGRWALALTDASALTDRVVGEIAHRKLAKAGPLCASSRLRLVVSLLRTLVGPPPSTVAGAMVYGRGLTRLERELEIRAGLPRNE